METTTLDLEKYRNDGSGLSNAAFDTLQKAMDTLPDIIAIEFGSGLSTQFLLDYSELRQKNCTSTPLIMTKNSSILMHL